MQHICFYTFIKYIYLVSTDQLIIIIYPIFNYENYEDSWKIELFFDDVMLILRHERSWVELFGKQNRYRIGRYLT